MGAEMSGTYEKASNIVGMIVAGLVLFGSLVAGSFFIWDSNSKADVAVKTVAPLMLQVENNTDAINQLRHVDDKRNTEMKLVKGELKYHGDILKSIADKVGAEIPIKDPIK